MANPRKFSEKIALLKQKEAEEKGNYERILREVRAVTHHPGQGPQMPMPGGPLPGMGPMRMNPLLNRVQGQNGMGMGPRNALWSSMPNIHSAAQNAPMPQMPYNNYNSGSQGSDYFYLLLITFKNKLFLHFKKPYN